LESFSDVVLVELLLEKLLCFADVIDLLLVHVGEAIILDVGHVRVKRIDDAFDHLVLRLDKLDEVSLLGW